MSHERKPRAPPESPGAAAPGPGPLRVLVVDDEPGIRRTVALCLRGAGCEVEQAASGTSAIELLRRRPIDLAFLDLRLEKEDGLEVLPRMLAERPDLDVVMITAYATIDTAVEAMRRGAKDYLPKPFTPAQIRERVERASERRASARSARADQEPPADPMETRSPRMRRTVQLVDRAARHDVPVLFRGEPGTGKGALARALHARSRRNGGPFVEVRCAAVPAERLAGEIFGRGRAGGGREHEGRLEVAEGGTLFLDDVADVPLDVQARLLGLIEDGRYERVGEARAGTADARIVAATSRDLDGEVKAGRFREDLGYAFETMEIPVPPLRARGEDVLPLAREYAAFFARRAGRPAPAPTPAAERALAAWSWPGNLRELRSAMEHAVLVAQGPEIGPEALPERVAAPGAGPATLGGDFTAEQVEREHIERVLARTAKLEEASRILGIDVTTLWRKRKRWRR